MARASKFTDEQRLEIALEMLSGKMSVAEICRKWDIGNTYAYKLKDRAMELLRNGIGRPGGAMTLTDADTTCLRLQDTGDPRDYGMADPGSNRKISFGHSITSDLGSAGNTIIDNGVTISFRARLPIWQPLDDAHPDGGSGVAPWPAGGDGYVTHNGGMGNFGIHQSGGKSISFALALASDNAELNNGGLVMNKLNGTSPTGDVDIQENDPGILNILPLADLTDWHEFWVTIEPDASTTGTHLVKVYMDGSLTPTNFLVTAGTGSLYSDSYLSMGVGSTPQSGAIDIDFFSYREDALVPNIPAPGALLLGGFGIGLVGWFRRRRTL